MNNISGLLKPDGYFYGIMLDSSYVWRKTQGNDLEQFKRPDVAVTCKYTEGQQKIVDGKKLLFNRSCATIDGTNHAWTTMEGSKGITTTYSCPLVHIPTLCTMASSARLQMLEFLNAMEFYSFKSEHLAHLKRFLPRGKDGTEPTTVPTPQQIDVVSLQCMYIFRKQTKAAIAISKSIALQMEDDLYEPPPRAYESVINTARKRKRREAEQQAAAKRQKRGEERPTKQTPVT
eukprot:TRINITY_DN66791_c6_g2_i1.p1 TRINITY_DN66791_c6_g2~~TRINITY_DN66791_c6_g2_i1.p1  ORF type:complete len:232 (+),score=24.59 TRINITY_DN66791_c6_g2_i1:203-898(+)